MFEKLRGHKTAQKKKSLLAIGSILTHLVAALAIILVGFWEMTELRRPNRGVVMAAGITASSGGPEQTVAKKLQAPKKKRVRDQVQPKANQEQEDVKESESSNTAGKGKGDGVGLGDGDGIRNGDGIGKLCLDPERCLAMPKVPKTDKREAPKLLSPAIFRNLQRIAGEAEIRPPTSAQNAMLKAGEKKIIAIIKVCLNKRGLVNRQTIVKSSNFVEYDAKIRSKIRKWRYQPFTVNGSPIAVCTLITFIYQQSP